MIVNDRNLDLAFKDFKTVYTDAYDKAPVTWDKIAMTVPSQVARRDLWLAGPVPEDARMAGRRAGRPGSERAQVHHREPQVRKHHRHAPREDFDDDRPGVFKPMIAEMGHEARRPPEEPIYGLLVSGFTARCVDGQPFFDPDHPSVDADGNAVAVSNVQAGTDPARFLLDMSGSIKPVVWQERER